MRVKIQDELRLEHSIRRPNGHCTHTQTTFLGNDRIDECRQISQPDLDTLVVAQPIAIMNIFRSRFGRDELGCVQCWWVAVCVCVCVCVCRAMHTVHTLQTTTLSSARTVLLDHN